MAIIRFDYALACRQAAQLEEQAARLRTLAGQKYAATLGTVSGAWKGDAANTFLQKAAVLQCDMVTTASQLEAAAAQVRRSAKRLYDAEQAAKRIAEERRY